MIENLFTMILEMVQMDVLFPEAVIYLYFFETAILYIHIILYGGVSK